MVAPVLTREQRGIVYRTLNYVGSSARAKYDADWTGEDMVASVSSLSAILCEHGVPFLCRGVSTSRIIGNLMRSSSDMYQMYSSLPARRPLLRLAHLKYLSNLKPLYSPACTWVVCRGADRVLCH